MSKVKKLAKTKFRAVTARVLIKASENEFLFLKRAPTKTHADKWDLPGGSVEPGETPEQTAIREVKEETGLVLRNVKPVALLKTKNRLRILFTAVVDEPFEPVLDLEHIDCLWVEGIKSRPKNMHKNTNKLIKKYHNKS